MGQHSRVVFSCVGDSTAAYTSWLNSPQEYDTAVVYYGNDDNIWDHISKTATISWRHSGFVFPSLQMHFHQLQGYDNFLITDDDLHLKPERIKRSFDILELGYSEALSWSRDLKSNEHFNHLRSEETGHLFCTNFLEQTMVFITKRLLKKLLNKASELEGQIIAGWDLLLANLAANTGEPPFLLLDFYSVYNPPPWKKPYGREIERTGKTFEERAQPVLDYALKEPHYFLILPEKFQRWGGSFSKPFLKWKAPYTVF
jgi:hypothetical protein